MTTPEMQARILRRILTQPVRVKLFTAINGNTEAGIVEVSGGGYSDLTLTLKDWKITNGKAEADVQNFKFDGSKEISVLGSYCVDPDGGALYVKTFKDGPLKVGRAGDIVPILPLFNLGMLS